MKHMKFNSHTIDLFAFYFTRVSAPVLLSGVFLVLSGCATLSEDECRQGDWYAIGFADGSEGHALTRLDRHRESCSEYSLGVDGESYLRGREAGLIHYCTRANGYEEGRSSRAYKDVCPAPLAFGFLDGYLTGLSATLQKIERDRDREEARFREVERRLAYTKDRKKREDLQEELKRIDGAINRIDDERQDLLELLDKAEYLYEYARGRNRHDF